jgi:hypothetical protein
MRAALRCCVLSLPLLSSLPTLAAKDISPKELDMACAITSVAEMRANPDNSETQTAAATLWVFYLGRLSALDDVTDWNKVVSDRVAEMGDKARSGDLFASCMDFFSSKIK